ncbi:MAG: hypothetical protein ACRC7V_03275 [Lachnospiraceae bacterium]
MKNTFKEKYLNGEIDFYEIDEYIETWGMDEIEGSLRTYIGITEQEEDAWINIGDEELKTILDSQKNNSTES